MPAAVTFFTVALAIHIAAVVIAFGAVFASPVLYAAMRRTRPSDAAAFHRMQLLLARFVVNPGLVLVLGFGIYLARHLSAFSKFYVSWGIAMIVVVGALYGSFFIPRERRLAALAEHDTGATFSNDYLALLRQVATVRLVTALLLLATIYFMTAQTG